MKTVITIGRQFGSAGHDIAQLVAEKLNIKLYDKELIERAAKDSGFCEEMIKNHDEKPTSSFLYNLVMDAYSYGYNASNYIDMPIGHKVFLAQFDAIKSIAYEGPCVIVGRCADYALSEVSNVLNIFIYANDDFKVKHIMSKIPDVKSEAKARDLYQKKDKQRASYYNYYANTKWGQAETYDLCINSSILGIEGTANLICQYVADFEKNL